MVYDFSKANIAQIKRMFLKEYSKILIIDTGECEFLHLKMKKAEIEFMTKVVLICT